MTFAEVHGDVPMLVAEQAGGGSSIAQLSVAETRTGTTEVEVCGGRGTCDTTRGLCVCARGWHGTACASRDH